MTLPPWSVCATRYKPRRARKYRNQRRRTPAPCLRSRQQTPCSVAKRRYEKERPLCVSSEFLPELWIRPGMLESLNESPHGFIQRRRDAGRLAAFHDGAVHEIDFCLPLGQDVLEHAGFVFSGRRGSF